MHSLICLDAVHTPGPAGYVDESRGWGEAMVRAMAHEDSHAPLL